MSKRQAPSLRNTCALEHVARTIICSLSLPEQLALRAAAGFLRDLVREHHIDQQRRDAAPATYISALSPSYLAAFEQLGDHSSSDAALIPHSNSSRYGNRVDFSLLHAAGLRQVCLPSTRAPAVDAVQLRGGPGTNQCVLSLLPLVHGRPERCIVPRRWLDKDAATPQLHACTVSYFEVSIIAPPARADVAPAADAAASMEQLREWYHPLEETSLSPRAAAQRLRYPACVAVGIAAPPFPVTGRMPGWDAHSFGYHSDDGAVFHGSGAGRMFGPTFGVGDTIGCGIIMHDAGERAPRLRRADAAAVQRFVATCDQLAAGHADASSMVQALLADAVVPCTQAQYTAMQDALARADAAVPTTMSNAWQCLHQRVDMLHVTEEDDSVLSACCTGEATGATLFFTLNGRSIGCASTCVPQHLPWYACTGIDAPYVCTVSFGDRAPFMYDVASLQRALWLRTELIPQPPVPRWVRALFPTVKHADAPRGAVIADSSGVSVAPPPPLSRSRHASFDTSLMLGMTASAASPLDAAADTRVDSARSTSGRTHSFNAAHVCTSRDERLGATILSAPADAVLRCKDAFPFFAGASVLRSSGHPCVDRDAEMWKDASLGAHGAVVICCMLRQQLHGHVMDLEESRLSAQAGQRAARACAPKWRLHATADAAIEALMMDAALADAPPPVPDPPVPRPAAVSAVQAAGEEEEEHYEDDDDDDVQSIDSEERRQWRK